MTPAGTAGSPILRAADAAGFTLDPAQVRAARRLHGVLELLGRGRRRRRRLPAGVYLWGPVGRGKTWLMDAFFDAAPTPGKRRAHFHRFFRELHATVHAQRGARHAFDAAVDELLHGCELLCFDEFHLNDVGDAMMMDRLLRTLLDRGVVLAATSNYPPRGLLPNPLFHHLFEPGIELIESSMEVVEVDGAVDYRAVGDTAAREGFRSGVFVRAPGGVAVRRDGLIAPRPAEATSVHIGHVDVPALRAASTEVWFAFHELCEANVSAIDLLDAAERFDDWVLTQVPRLSSCTRDAQQRFIHLVDILHDRDLRLTLMAEDSLEAVLAGENLPGDLQRTASRLQLLSREDDMSRAKRQP